MSELENLKKLEKKFNLAYRSGKPLVDDETYDALVDEIRRHGDSLELQDGVQGEEIQHSIPMLSLRKVTTEQEVMAFRDSVGATPLLVQKKADGVSLSLTYREGKLVEALTRGDGRHGVDILTRVKLLPSVPLTLSEPIDAVVRGEIVIPEDKLSDRYKNARNAVAGVVNTKDHTAAYRENAMFVAFDVPGLGRDVVSFLREQDFEVVPSALHQGGLLFETVKAMFELPCPYLCDGVVVKVLDQGQRDHLGSTREAPRWAFAYKQASETAVTTLLSVTWQVGKTGTVAPVAELAPVFVEGTEVSRATLHNASEIRKLRITIGASVLVRRAGSVIPRVEKALTTTNQAIVPPTSCPACSESLETFGNSGQIRCPSSECPAQTARKLIHWAGKSAADIDSMGPVWIEELAERGHLDRPEDFYRMDRGTFVSLEQAGEKRVSSFLEAINKSRGLGMRRALIGLAIPMAGEGTAERLTRELESVEAVANASVAKLASLEGVGVVAASSIHEFFERPETKKTLNSLRELGVNLDRLPEDAPLVFTEAEQGALTGKKVCVTGTLTCSREELHEYLKRHGAVVAKSVSSKTDVLIIGANVGKTKIEAARKHSVVVMSEQEARKALGE